MMNRLNSIWEHSSNLAKSFVIGLFASACLVTFLGPPVAMADGDSAPVRIVSLVPALTETLFALGVGERVVGVSDYCDMPSEALELSKVGTFVAPVAEAVLALRPDLVLTSPSPGNQGAVRALERAGVRVEVVGGDVSIDEVLETITRTAELVEEEPAGRALVAKIRSQLAEVRTLAAAKPTPLTAMVIGRDPLVLAGAPSYLGELLVLAGAENLGARVDGRWPRVGMEFLVAASPDVIVDVSTPMEAGLTAAAAQKRWEQFASVGAVKTGRVHAMDASILLRPGPRIGAAALLLLETLHASSPQALALPAKPSSPGESPHPGAQ